MEKVNTKVAIVVMLAATMLLASCSNNESKSVETTSQAAQVLSGATDSTGSVTKAEDRSKKHVASTMNDRFEQACRNVDGEIKHFFDKNGEIHNYNGVFSPGYSDGCFDDSGNNLDAKASENMPKTLTFVNTPEEEKACRDIKAVYDQYDKIAFPNGKIRHEGIDVNYFTHDASWIIHQAQEGLEKDYWNETDALDHVAELSDTDRYMSIEDGYSFAEANSGDYPECNLGDCDNQKILPRYDIAVWKSEPVGKACSIVFVKRGETPSVSKLNFTIAEIRLSDANITAKVLDGLNETVKDAQSNVDAMNERKKNLNTLGIQN